MLFYCSKALGGSAYFNSWIFFHMPALFNFIFLNFIDGPARFPLKVQISHQISFRFVSDTSLSFMKAVNFTRPGLRYSRFSSVKSCLSFLKVSASFLSFFSPDLRRKNRRYLSIFECFASTCYFPTLKPEWPFSSTSFRVHAFRFNRSLFSAWPHIYRRCS